MPDPAVPPAGGGLFRAPDGHETVAQLRAERDLAIQVMNALGQGLTVTGPDNTFEYVNPAYAHMVGLHPDDLVGRQPRDVTVVDDHETLSASGRRRQRGETTSYETRLRHVDGHTVPVLVTGSPRYVDGAVAGAIAVITDLTQLKGAERALRSSELRLRAMLGAVPDLIVVNRRDGTYVDVRASRDDLLVWPVDDVIGRRIADVLPADAARERMAMLERACETGQMQELQYELDVDGARRTFEARVVPTSDDEVITIIRDISERARLESMKSDFVNRAAHELRTPLATIVLMADLIQEGGSPDELAEYWRILNAEVRRQRVLVEDLMTVGRLESGHFELVPEPLDVRLPLQDAVTSTRLMAAARRQHVALEVSGVLPHVVGDHRALHQAFVNVISNAVKYSPEDATIHVRVGERDGGVDVAIIDTGIGIPAADLPHLFERFFRARNAIELEVQGTGVGLHIVHAIVTALGGTVQVTSAVGTGTTIRIWLQAPAA
ncbi:MAG: PAS domain-containing protein [Acidobacteria bacterium]|nr:PAS domain-containing protein [Acidobacteriota bacterium]